MREGKGVSRFGDGGWPFWGFQCDSMRVCIAKGESKGGMIGGEVVSDGFVEALSLRTV